MRHERLTFTTRKRRHPSRFWIKLLLKECRQMALFNLTKGDLVIYS
jgi:hypothetical protein